MRSKLFLLAATAMLAVSTSAQAVLTLEFWVGNQSTTPFNPVTPSPTNPATIAGMRNWAVTPAGNLAPGGLNLNSGTTSLYVLKVVLRDFDNVGDGSGFTLSGDGSFANAAGLATFAMRFGWTAGQGINATRDSAASDGQAQTVTVWNGASLGPTATNENANFAVADAFGPNFFTVGNIFGSPSNGNSTGQQVDATNVLYPLANLLLNVSGAGNGQITLSKPTTAPPTFGSIDGLSQVSYDTQVWGAGGTNVYSIPFTVVPEPSSMVLAGLAISGLGYRLRRKFRRETTTA